MIDDKEERVQKYFYPLNRAHLSTCPSPSGRWTDDPRKNGVSQKSKASCW
jgi:hypothetical protein